MSEDIVTRLEALASNYKTTEFEFVHADYETVCEASSEIERLRELADNFYKTMLYYQCQCSISPCKCGYDDMMDEYKEVRGE